VLSLLICVSLSLLWLLRFQYPSSQSVSSAQLELGRKAMMFVYRLLIDRYTVHRQR